MFENESFYQDGLRWTWQSDYSDDGAVFTNENNETWLFNKDPESEGGWFRVQEYDIE